MKISKTDLVKLIIKANNQGYNLAVKHADRNYDKFSADFREAQAKLRDEYEKDLAEAERRASSIEAQVEERAAEAYEAGRREALSDEALASAKSQAYEAGYAKAQEEAHKVGYQRGLAEGMARAENHEEAYNSGYAQGLSDGKHKESSRLREIMAEARESERQKIEAAEPKLSVWFRPCGPMPVSNEGEVLGCPPGLDKLKAIKAIRQAYTHAEGYGLKEVKDMVETVSFGARFAAGQPLPQSKAVELYLQLQAAGFDPVLRAQD